MFLRVFPGRDHRILDLFTKMPGVSEGTRGGGAGRRRRSTLAAEQAPGIFMT